MGRMEIDGRLYAIIDTHADLTKGTRYLVPIMKHRHVSFDGYKETQKAVEHGISRELGLARGVMRTTRSQLNYT